MKAGKDRGVKNCGSAGMALGRNRLVSTRLTRPHASLLERLCFIIIVIIIIIIIIIIVIIVSTIIVVVVTAIVIVIIVSLNYLFQFP